MKYKNTKTGAVIELNSILSGGDWEAVATKEISPIEEAPKETKRKRTK